MEAPRIWPESRRRTAILRHLDLMHGYVPVSVVAEAACGGEEAQARNDLAWMEKAFLACPSEHGGEDCWAITDRGCDLLRGFPPPELAEACFRVIAAADSPLGISGIRDLLGTGGLPATEEGITIALAWLAEQKAIRPGPLSYLSRSQHDPDAIPGWWELGPLGRAAAADSRLGRTPSALCILAARDRASGRPGMSRALAVTLLDDIGLLPEHADGPGRELRISWSATPDSDRRISWEQDPAAGQWIFRVRASDDHGGHRLIRETMTADLGTLARLASESACPARPSPPLAEALFAALDESGQPMNAGQFQDWLTSHGQSWTAETLEQALNWLHGSPAPVFTRDGTDYRFTFFGHSIRAMPAWRDWAGLGLSVALASRRRDGESAMSTEAAAGIADFGGYRLAGDPQPGEYRHRWQCGDKVTEITWESDPAQPDAQFLTVRARQPDGKWVTVVDGWCPDIANLARKVAGIGWKQPGLLKGQLGDARIGWASAALRERIGAVTGTPAAPAAEPDPAENAASAIPPPRRPGSEPDGAAGRVTGRDTPQLPRPAAKQERAGIGRQRSPARRR